ncbi:MAG: DUF1294 domain-containing protein [Lentisphaerae bacterium]|nr:DUF1294 domain-containing protein [Lentisphaerota bacterium]
MNKVRISLLILIAAGFILALIMGRMAIYMLTVSIAVFAAFGLDKYCAIKRWRRFPEAYLLLLTVLGGGAAALGAMCVFRHKIRKWKFWAVATVFTAVQIFIFTRS